MIPAFKVMLLYPDFFEFSFDSRHEKPEVLEQVLAIVKSCADKTWNGCKCEVVKAWNRDTVYWDKKLVSYVKKAAEETGVSHQYIHSGAGHDAQFCAYVIPTTMIFVQSKDGLSHCEPEYSKPEHCTDGATVMLNAVLEADKDESLLPHSAKRFSLEKSFAFFTTLLWR